MQNRKYLPYFLLFLMSFCAGMIPLLAPMEHTWTLEGLLLAKNLSWSDILKPFFGDSTLMSYFRPLSLFLLKILYLLFDFTIPAYRTYKALCLSCFTLSVYTYLNLLFPKKERQNFYITILCALSPPVIISSYMIIAEDVPGSAFLFASLALLLCLIKGKHKDKPSIICWFYVCIVCTCLIRETSRAHLLLLILVHLFHFRKEASGDAKKHSGYALGITGVTIGLSFVLFRHAAPAPWLKLSPTSTHVIFLAQNAFSQIIACISLPVMLLIIFSVLLQKVYMKPKPSRFSRITVFLLFLFFIKKQPLISYSFIGLYVFSPNPILPLSALFFTFTLLLKLKSSKPEDAFCAKAILIVFFATLAATLFLKTAREDLPSRTFITLLPFLYYFTVQAAQSLYGLWEEQKQKGNSTFFLSGALSYFSINLLLFFLIFPMNYAFEFQANTFVSRDSKLVLAKQPLQNSLIFYTNDAFPTHYEDVRLLNPSLQNKNVSSQMFFPIEPFKPGTTEQEKYHKLKEEICLKAGGLYVHVQFKKENGNTEINVTRPKEFKGFVEKAYIHILGEKTTISLPEKAAYFEGDFMPYAKDSLPEFVPSKKFSSRGYWEYSLPVIMQKYRFSHTSDLENFLSSLKLKPAYDTTWTFNRLPQSLEEAWVWFKYIHRFAFQQTAQSKIYSLKVSQLNCYGVLHLKPGTHTVPNNFYDLP